MGPGTINSNKDILSIMEQDSKKEYLADCFSCKQKKVPVLDAKFVTTSNGRYRISGFCGGKNEKGEHCGKKVSRLAKKDEEKTNDS